jgi:ornithine cyclodeaminase
MIVPNDAPTMFWLKGASLKALGVAGVSFGAQFGDYYFMVNDCKTGTLRGIVEQSWLFKRRTGASAVVTAMKLARSKSTVAALVGAGQIGEEVVRCLPHAFRLSDFRVASRTFEGASAFVERLKPEVDAPLRAVASAEEAIRGADIVITITLASEPFVRAGWLKEGALLVSMGGVHEVDHDVLAEIDRVVVDDPGHALLRGDFASWVDRGEITLDAMRQRIDADIGEIVFGSKPGRSSESERILAVIQGMAVCDLATAAFLLDKAAAAGAGQSLAVEPQMALPELTKMKPRAESITSGLRRRRPPSGVST